MNKKIAAVISVIILLVSVLAACGKVPTIKNSAGEDVPVATDSEGNTMLNGDGDIIVYVTDEDGKYVKDNNGERVTSAVEFPRVIADGQKVETADYVMTFPKEWVINENGAGSRKGTEGEFLSIDKLDALKIGETVEMFADKPIKQMQAFGEEQKGDSGKAVFETHSTAVTEKKLKAVAAENDIVKADGTKMYVCSVWFEFDGTVYLASYLAPVGKDKAPDVVELLNSGLVMKSK